MLQYTSGSTANPVVVLSVRNVQKMSTKLSVTGFSCEGRRAEAQLGRFVVPLYHDMGLMVGLFYSVVCRMSVILTSPRAFVVSLPDGCDCLLNLPGAIFGHAPTSHSIWRVFKTPKRLWRGWI